MVKSRAAVDRWRPVKENKVRPALPGIHALFKNAVAIPPIEVILLELREIHPAVNWLKHQSPRIIKEAPPSRDETFAKLPRYHPVSPALPGHSFRAHLYAPVPDNG